MMTLCTVCQGPAGEVILRGVDRLHREPFAVRRCTTCSTAFTVPRPDDLGRYYPDAYHAFRPVPLTPLERARLRITASTVYRPITARPPGMLLDVGCGSGRLGGAFRRSGWTVAGIEPSAEGARVARKSGMDVHTGTLDDDLPWAEDTFDAVVFNHSLEHVAHPVAALRRAASLTRPGGLIGVTVPNFNSWQRRLFGGEWEQLEVPKHLTHFDRMTLRGAVERAGLAVVKLSATSMMAGATGSVVRKLGLRPPPRAQRGVALATYPLLAATDLVVEGDCLNLVARVPPAPDSSPR